MFFVLGEQFLIPPLVLDYIDKRILRGGALRSG